MRKFIINKIIPAVLIICFVTSSFIALSKPKPVEAAGAACSGGMVVAIGQLVWATIKGTVSAQTGTEGPTQRFLGNYKDAGAFINDCILKPLAQMMVVALIRNIGASIVNWVNSGFEGKPSFVTDFGGTLLNAADQAAGNFIESNTDLGFLCSPFSFQIRLALALKYSQPFNDQVRCTLTNIGNNVSNFANNNGGAGWDNWLKVTAQPQNNVYGAYLMADSELAKRMAGAVDQKEKKIALGQGFLDFETCDVEEDPSQYKLRQQQLTSKDPAVKADAAKVQVTTSVFDSTNIGSDPTVKNEFVDGTGAKPICLQKTTKTPGRVIADQLQSEFSTGPIQRAVAQEIDQVISATLNQLAQKAIQGASGLLGLSQKRQSSSGTSYLDKYRAQYYSQGTTATVNDTGAQSELDSYTVNSYNDALALRNDPNNPDVQSIDNFTNTAGGSEIQAQQNQVGSTVNAYAGSVTERNVAIGKQSTESSTLNPASGGNDGVKQTSQYIKGAETSSGEAGGWWEVDLGESKQVSSINIYPATTPSAANGGLGTFTVEVRDDTGTPTTYQGSSFTGTSPLTATIGRMGRYVKITRQASETFCADDAYGRTYSDSSPCADQPHLAFAELEVIEKVDANATASSTQSTSGTGGSTTTTAVDNATPTSTLAWNPQTANVQVTSSAGINQELQLTSKKSVSGLVVTVSLYDSNGRNVPFQNVLSNFDILRGPSGGSWTSSQSYINSSVANLRVGVSINQNSGFSFKLTGTKKAGVSGNYSFIFSVSDSTGTNLEDKTQRTNFVVQ